MDDDLAALTTRTVAAAAASAAISMCARLKPPPIQLKRECLLTTSDHVTITPPVSRRWDGVIV